MTISISSRLRYTMIDFTHNDYDCTSTNGDDNGNSNDIEGDSDSLRQLNIVNAAQRNGEQYSTALRCSAAVGWLLLECAFHFYLNLHVTVSREMKDWQEEEFRVLLCEVIAFITAGAVSFVFGIAGYPTATRAVF